MAVLLPFYLIMDKNSITTDKPLNQVVNTIESLLVDIGIHTEHKNYFWNYSDPNNGSYVISVYATENKQHIVEPRSLNHYKSEEFNFLVHELHKILG